MGVRGKGAIVITLARRAKKKLPIFWAGVLFAPPGCAAPDKSALNPCSYCVLLERNVQCMRQIAGVKRYSPDRSATRTESHPANEEIFQWWHAAEQRQAQTASDAQWRQIVGKQLY